MKTYKKIRGSYYEDVHSSCKPQSWFYETREQYMIKFADLKKTDVVLDIGCGSGVVTRKIARNVGCRTTGIDISEACINHAASKSREEQLKNIDFRVGSIENIPSSDGKFDVIIASHIIEHIRDTEKALEQIYKKLKNNGKVIITTPNYASLWPIAEFTFDKTLTEKGYSLHEQHITKFNMLKLKSLLRRTGFEDVNAETHYVVSLPLSLFSTKIADFFFNLEQKISSLPFGAILYTKGIRKS
ncbi:MAG: class I SAM-dependent methyltransferase [Candidatus Aenigmarchaeota archaeon]|nr:class I SAM-dependent methyltransferase [Candidatus Aenigmarchaeota archaeon]